MLSRQRQKKIYQPLADPARVRTAGKYPPWPRENNIQVVYGRDILKGKIIA